MLDADLTLYAFGRYCERGYEGRLRLMAAGTKRLAFKEADRPTTREAIEAELRRHQYNLAVLLNDGLIELDKDGPNQGRFQDVTSNFAIVSARGEKHLFRTDADFRNKIKIDGLDVDLRCHGVTVVPPSVHPTGHRYATKNGVPRIEELAVFPPELVPAEAPEVVVGTVTSTRAETGRVLYPEAYCMTVESEQGKNGSAKLVKVVITMRNAGRSVQETWDFLVKWNAVKANPPWSERELWHAVKRHYGLK